MKIKNHFKELGDAKDSCEIELSNEEFEVFHHVFTRVITYRMLRESGLSDEQARTACAFASLF